MKATTTAEEVVNNTENQSRKPRRYRIGVTPALPQQLQWQVPVVYKKNLNNTKKFRNKQKVDGDYVGEEKRLCNKIEDEIKKSLKIFESKDTNATANQSKKENTDVTIAANHNKEQQFGEQREEATNKKRSRRLARRKRQKWAVGCWLNEVYWIYFDNVFYSPGKKEGCKDFKGSRNNCRHENELKCPTEVETTTYQKVATDTSLKLTNDVETTKWLTSKPSWRALPRLKRLPTKWLTPSPS
ncbi:hypothetical protein BSL78_02258 [Apostichopus japonicus]|uniref:Uncharacterized protein n=1 Tax=Stichopus japonicus TaxID=307972 RepID=A0A2G8LKJ1_STIJA|nr:hypothetical protein BSL78_02258 [Apostichopus japonicus]